MRDLTRKLEPRPSAKHPIALLALLTLVAIVAGLFLLSQLAQGQNERQAALEKDHVAAAVRDLHAHVVHDLAGLSEQTVLVQPPTDIGVLDQLLLITANDMNSVAQITGSRPKSSDLDHAVLEFVQPIFSGATTTTGGMIAPGDLFDVAALSIPQPSGEISEPGSVKVLVGVRQVDPDYLAELARLSGVRRLELIYRTSDGMAGRGAWSSNAWRGFGLNWEPRRPGDQLMLRWTVIVMAITSAIAVIIILRARREAGRLLESEARAVEASRNDWLSGLPNRVFFNHVLERDLKSLKQGDGKLALFYLDVDRFKEINDTFGQETGDLMIQAVTRRIEAVLTSEQSLARFEGDAFSVLLPGIEDRADCERFAERIKDVMKAPFEAKGTSITLSLSMGIALAPDDATERSELVRLANLALYRAKREGRDRFAFFQPDLQCAWRRRATIENALPEAIANGGLVLRYQPIVDCQTGQVVCAEALVRWNHPVEGLIAPDDFIGFAEDRGLIVPLGEWVLREACTVAKAWGDTRIAVNVSPIQFRHKGFVDQVMRIVEETGLEPGRLELELTEGVLADHKAEALAAMATLRGSGIRLAIDDFGTGYSSLIYLRRFAVDKIKIDRAFVESLEPNSEAETLLTSIVQLGRALGLTVTAEGIETPAQRDFLRRTGCEQLQGYLFARPLPEAEFVAFLRDNHAERRLDGTLRAVA